MIVNKIGMTISINFFDSNGVLEETILICTFAKKFPNCVKINTIEIQ